jgi:hypothetical protein
MPPVDVAIVAGLVEEFGNLRRLVPDLIEDDSSSNAEIWYRGRLRANADVSYSAVAAFQTDMDRNKRALLSRKSSSAGTRPTSSSSASPVPFTVT